MFTIAADLCIALLWAMPFVAFGFVFILHYPLSRVQIASTRDEVGLCASDPGAMRWFLFAGIFLSCVVLQFAGVAAGSLSASLTLLTTLGCQVDLWVTRHGSRVTRRTLGFLPWSVWHSGSAATLDWDDYNDLLVPDALRIRLDVDSLEIAWLGRGSGERPLLLTAEFNAAVRALQDAPLQNAPLKNTFGEGSHRG